MIGKQIGRFRIVAELGRGGMGVVYEAVQTNLDRRVAVKMISAELAASEEHLARFRREAETLARLAHPGIVGILDVEEADGRPCLVMEFVDGPPLSRLLRTEGRLDAARVRELGIALSAALAAAHRRGIVHRDVKPDNVLLTGDGRPKLTDFGIAHMRDSHLRTRTGLMLGTPFYMSPEQARGQPVSRQSDVYALGVVLYELLAGSVPFTADSPLAVALMHLRDEPEPLAARAPDVPPALCAVVHRALAKSLVDRFGSAEELHAALLAVPLDGAGRVDPAADRGGGGGGGSSSGSGTAPGAKAAPAARESSCGVCGAGVGTEFLRCAHCGASLRERCGRCGRIYDAAAVECPACRTPAGSSSRDDPAAGPWAVAAAIRVRPSRRTLVAAGVAALIAVGAALAAGGARPAAEAPHATPPSSASGAASGGGQGAFRAGTPPRPPVATTRAVTTSQVEALERLARDGGAEDGRDDAPLATGPAAASAPSPRAPSAAEPDLPPTPVDAAAARHAVEAVIERQRLATEVGDVRLFLADLAPELQTTWLEHFERLHLAYSEIRSRITRPRIDLDRPRHATASFHVRITGRSAATGRREELSNQVTAWRLEERGGRWTIVQVLP